MAVYVVRVIKIACGHVRDGRWKACTTVSAAEGGNTWAGYVGRTRGAGAHPQRRRHRGAGRVWGRLECGQHMLSPGQW